MALDASPRSRFLTQMAERYCWDASASEARSDERRVMRRVMDLGVLDDILRLEQVIGRDELAMVLGTAPPGSLRPKSWWFWHYRLRLTDPEDLPPPMPVRRLA